MPYYNQSVPTIPLSDLNPPTTKLIGYVRDSGNLPIMGGWFEITADSILTDGANSNKSLVIPKPRRFPLSADPLNIDLINSQYSETTYRIRVGETVNAVDIVYADFHTQIPYGQSVDIADLAPTQIVRESLPGSLYRIAEIILNDVNLRNQLIRVFEFRGNWGSNTQYSPYDLVFVPGSPNRTFICTTAHISGATFNPNNFQQLI